MAYFLISPLEQGGLDPFAFTYEGNGLGVGQLVKVPFGRRQSLGVVIGPADQPAGFTAKAITETVDHPPLPRHLVDLAAWLADYYCASAKAVWQTLLPAGLLVKRRIAKVQGAVQPPEPQDYPLTKTQAAALETISASPMRTTLLQGITGSGKTLLYIELARQALAAGRSAIILVPEIALTPQMLARLQGAFGSIIATHSHRTPAERHRAWRQALEATEPQIVLGPRSALFLPVPRPGLIILDECHETSYKQEQAPRYQTDAVAAKLAGLTDAKLILGSATPSLNQKYLATRGRLNLVRLDERASGGPLPSATIIDLRDKTQLTRSRFISDPLLGQLRDTLANGRQSLLFINRRGSATSLICADCGHTTACPNCHIPLTFHADRLRLVCHYCDFQVLPPATCSECAGADLRYLGGGTKRIESELTSLLPDARLLRLDKDATADRHFLNQAYRQLRAGDIDILIGTQMVAKGWDLSAIDTVGVVSADTMLTLPDFGAAERTFQLITQVAGRAGRGDRPGQVLIQTYNPDHPAIQTAAKHDYESFAAAELEQRRLLGYPPYRYLLKLACSGTNLTAVQAKANRLAAQLANDPRLETLGPAPAFREHASGKLHWQLIVRSKQRAALTAVARAAGSGWSADPDPINLL